MKIASVISRRDSLRQSAALLFRQVTQDAQNYRNAVFAWHHATVLVRKLAPSAGQLVYPQQYYSAYDRTFDTHSEVESVRAVLSADITSLRLLFGKASDPTAAAIRELVGLVHRMPTGENSDEYSAEFSKWLKQIDKCIHELFHNQIETIDMEAAFR